MNHKAIYALYPNVVSINDSTGAYDAEGNLVTLDMDAVNAWTDPDQYKYDRALEYPSMADQLDMMYWDNVNGTTTWKDKINEIKAKYPKPE